MHKLTKKPRRKHNLLGGGNKNLGNGKQILQQSLIIYIKIHFQNYHLIKVGKINSKDLYNIMIEKKKKAIHAKNLEV